MILVDTSVWIEVFRARRPVDLEALVDFDDVATCLPVIQEVLQGFRDEGAYRRARQAMLALPIAHCAPVLGRRRLVPGSRAAPAGAIRKSNNLLSTSSACCIIRLSPLRQRS